ncbi:hypothetical protein E4L95_18990 [Paracoccus liaowanqingii]|uniref:Uncharacterized protein n=1 Tax=Paracoccus liaowanqingii TaxID=2560053 RepID=A0A4Z1C7P6_9RHOB|nr:hypothetical protein [Paracoccus liaowanqingii]TGN47899.1 hypothetical protein E4L95_18990 [Paracoccus liaowanqingii]
MMTGMNAWTELACAGLGMMTTGLRASETMAASGSVISARVSIMGNAACRPAEGDYAEITDMVVEKVVAISKVSQVIVSHWSALLVDASEQAQHLSRVMVGGRPLSTGDLAGLADRWMAHGTRIITRSMDAGGLVLAPVHQQATANAERLR